MITTLPMTLTVDGKEHDIRTDFRVILDCIAALNDNELTDSEKMYTVMQIIYIDPDSITDIEEAIKQAFWFISCDTEKNSTQKELMRWEQDFKIIVPAVNRVLGYECREREQLHWWTFIGAFNEIGECYFQSVVSIRDKKARHKKLEKWEQEFYNRNREEIDLETRYSKEEEELFAKLGI